MNFNDLIIYLPVGIVGLLRWASWVFRRIPAARYSPCRSGHREPISIVVPVYQEKPEIFRRAIESWLANDVTEIICVIDETDTACIAVANEYPVTLMITGVPGKRDALCRGWEHASTPLVALVDSDTIWAPDVADRVCEPFADPRVGGVGARQNAYEPTTVWERFCDIYLDNRYFLEYAAETVMGAAVSCLSGRTAVYRRELLMLCREKFLKEKFLGVPCNSGDDKRLTSLILEMGYRTFMQQSARVWSTFPQDVRTFFCQRIRWARNTWRSDLRALSSRWIYKRPFLAYVMVDKAISSFTLTLSPIYFCVALTRGDWLPAAILVAWWHFSRAVKFAPHFRRRPVHLAILPLFIPISFAVSAARLYALCTIRTQRWLTRDVAVVRGVVVRLQSIK